MSMRPERSFPAQVASEGLAIGRISLRRMRRSDARPKGTPEEEIVRLEAAGAAASAQLERLIGRAEAEAAAILEFQAALLADDELLDPVRARIARGEAADAAWQQAMDGQIADYQGAEDEYFRARALDLADLRDRVAELLAGGGDEAGAPAETGAIYVGTDLAPSRFLELDWDAYRGGAVVKGSSASHVAILARARGVPLVVGLAANESMLVDGAEAILDAEAGQLIQDPSAETRARYLRRAAEREAEARRQASHLGKPALTAAGERVLTYINVDDPHILPAVDPASCDGVGLTRTEFLFSGEGGLPGEGRQLGAYKALMRWAGGRPVTIRTLDAGGDKPIPGLTPDGESNPFLGLRGLRLSLARPDVFRVQLRALARAAIEGELKVMLPMVTRPQELDATRAMFRQVVSELLAEGIPAAMPKLGMMVEVPAAALNIAAFDADFFSIGSNDLVQYVTAAGRDCEAVRDLYDPLEPGVLELIHRVAEHGRLTGREVSLCGDMASDPKYLPALLDAGLRAVSVAPARLARAKAEIAGYG
ncbi:MAG TPA: phosphoenolpyruvate--protein phosphotransferase [Hypericibacter adhaerens]|jgi:phosphotransferase system enzyme I (PtsI)|nr:phosphoenolpyruvate--protein phosphotransferase [Hypericibacter adhaerens]HWA44213.1 phosphoenolpyruvate--protein phosphotransferase [Hypericibacter adhaerens]